MLPSFEIMRAAYVFVWRNRRDCLRILWLPLLLAVLLIGFVRSHIALVNGCNASAQLTSLSSRSTVVIFSWLLLLVVALTVLGSIMCSGLWRLALRDTRAIGPFYLKLGRDEQRLLVLAGLKASLLVAWGGASAGFIGLGEILWTHFAGTFSPGLFLLLLLLALVVLGWGETRFSLSGPAAIATEHIGLVASWRATAHHVFWLQRVATLLAIPVAVVSFVSLALLLVIFWSNTVDCRSGLARCQYAWPLLLAVSYCLLLGLIALFLVGRALEYQELSRK